MKLLKVENQAAQETIATTHHFSARGEDRVFLNHFGSLVLADFCVGP